MPEFRQAPSPRQSSDPTIRRCQRVLRMVAELHKRGFQRLRVMPHIYGGSIWRLVLGPCDWFSNRMGVAMTVDGLERAPQYSSMSENRPFEWHDAEKDDARALASKMVERFPELLSASVGQDWEYAGWFVELIGWVEAGFLPFINPANENVRQFGWEPPAVAPLTLVGTPLYRFGSRADFGSNRCPLPPVGGGSGEPVQMTG